MKILNHGLTTEQADTDCHLDFLFQSCRRAGSRRRKRASSWTAPDHVWFWLRVSQIRRWERCMSSHRRNRVLLARWKKQPSRSCIPTNSFVSRLKEIELYWGAFSFISVTFSMNFLYMKNVRNFLCTLVQVSALTCCTLEA